MSDDFSPLDATAQAELVRSGQVSPLELVEAAISRIEKLNPEINAVIHTLFDQATESARGSLPDGPFRGVPLLLKDLGAGLAGQPYHLGTKLLKEHAFRLPMDTYLGQRFRNAGFVTLGKTNVPEFGILPTTEPKAYGATKNPWDTTRSAGGSSGGSAAAVASGMVAIAHANDGGGSIRIPASENGLVGLKTTRQRISEGPLLGDNMSGLTVELAVSKSVRDTAAILDAVQGPAPGDPYFAPPVERPYVEELGADPGSLRIGVWTDPITDDVAHPDVVAAANEAARLLESLGHSLERADLSDLEGLDLYGSFLVRWGAGQAALLRQVGMLIGKDVTEGDVEPLTWNLAQMGLSSSAADYLGAISQHQVMGRMVARVFESGLDLILSPTLGEPPPPLGTFDDSGPDPLVALERARLTATFCAAFNATGHPAISLPLGQNADGMPIGVQLVAAAGREDLLIRVASQLETASPWADRVAPMAG